MWDKWKRKLQNFIWKEEIEEKEDDHTYHQSSTHYIDKNQHVQTKMVYQYPKKQSFPFPAIPDKPVSKKRSDVPAYKRRQVQDDFQKQKNSVSENIESVDVFPEEKKVIKQDNKPFKPSRVASPIYGYQKRHQDEEVQEVPAYLRKESSYDRDTSMRENSTQSIFENESEEEASTNYEASNSTSIHRSTPDNESLLHHEVNKNVNMSEMVEPTEEVPNHPAIEPEEYNEDEIEFTESREENKPTEQAPPKMKDKQISVNKEKTKKESSVPFNVMMTPLDKKRLFDKQQAEKAKEQLSSTTDTNNSKSDETRETLPNYLLDDPVQQNETNHLWVEEQRALLEKTLKHFNVQAQVVNATQGPSVTRFEVKPELGVKVSRIRNLSDDLKLNMAAKDIRIEAPIPGKNTVGIEVPNLEAEKVGLQEIFETETFEESKSSLTVALGLDIEGNSIVTDLQKMPHGLIAGATGSGKSVCINTILISLLYKASHEDVRLLLIDPKMVELTQYNGIPHLVSPVITDVKAATAALKWAVQEMENRYEKFVHEGVRDIEKYNEKAVKNGEEKMPFIVIVIDELADLMMISPQDVEDSISRIAQKARACGIHLLLATQRPSVDVITGLIKANIPTRIAFSVSSQVDSRTILDVGGAEKLLGRGDMLFVENGAGKSIRLQGAFVSDEEIDRVTDYARKIASPHYLFEQETLLEEMTMMEEDELMQDAIDFVVRQDGASTSLLQRNFKIGYNRAARLIDSLEQKGIISGQKGSKPRDVLMTQSQIDELRHGDG